MKSDKYPRNGAVTFGKVILSVSSEFSGLSRKVTSSGYNFSEMNFIKRAVTAVPIIRANAWGDRKIPSLAVGKNAPRNPSPICPTPPMGDGPHEPIALRVKAAMRTTS